MRHKKILTLFVTLLTVVSMLFSTAVTASAGPNDPTGYDAGTNNNQNNNPNNGQQEDPNDGQQEESLEVPAI